MRLPKIYCVLRDGFKRINPVSGPYYWPCVLSGISNVEDTRLPETSMLPALHVSGES